MTELLKWDIRIAADLMHRSTSWRRGGWCGVRVGRQLDLQFKGRGVATSLRDITTDSQTHRKAWKKANYFDEYLLRKQVLWSKGTFQMQCSARLPVRLRRHHRATFRSVVHLYILMERFGSHRVSIFWYETPLPESNVCTVSGRLTFISPNNTSIDSVQSIPVEHS